MVKRANSQGFDDVSSGEGGVVSGVRKIRPQNNNIRRAAVGYNLGVLITMNLECGWP